MPQNTPMNTKSLLDQVVAELEARTGSLREVADQTGIPYDTVLRIKNRENDPSFSKVQTLHSFLFARGKRKQGA